MSEATNPAPEPPVPDMEDAVGKVEPERSRIPPRFVNKPFSVSETPDPIESNHPMRTLKSLTSDSIPFTFSVSF